MKALIIKLAIKALLIFCVIFFLSSCLDVFVPVISNEIALGQLENSNELFILMQSYNKLINYLAIVCYLCIGALLCFAGYDIYEYIKIKNYIKNI